MAYSSAIGFFSIGQSPIGSLLTGGQYLLITGVGTFGYVPDWQQSPFNLSYVIEVPAGTTISYTVLFTVDDLTDPTWTPIWLPDITHAGALTATAAGKYNWPIRGLQLAVASISGGNARFAVLQGSRSR